MVKDKEFIKDVEKELKKIAGDRYEVRIVTTRKNNDSAYTGIIVRENEKNIAPTVYLEPYYEMYSRGISIRCIANWIMDTATKESAPSGIDTDFHNFGKYTDKVIFQLVNRDMNAELLKSIPYVPIYDNLVMIFAIMVMIDNTGMGTVKITNEHMNLWGVDKDILHELAIENTPRLLPERMERLADVLDRMCSEMQDEIPQGVPEGLDVPPMFILSNLSRLNGAAVMAYPGTLDRISERLGSDLVILPSSIHEVIVVPHREDDDFQQFEEMVKEVNRTQVANEEILSNTVYLYQRSTGKVTLPLAAAA